MSKKTCKSCKANAGLNFKERTGCRLGHKLEIDIEANGFIQRPAEECDKPLSWKNLYRIERWRGLR